MGKLSETLALAQERARSLISQHLAAWQGHLKYPAAILRLEHEVVAHESSSARTGEQEIV